MADVKSDRRQALELALSQIDRQFGKGANDKACHGPAFGQELQDLAWHGNACYQ